jgi:hypothetical protein
MSAAVNKTLTHVSADLLVIYAGLPLAVCTEGASGGQ